MIYLVEGGEGKRSAEVGQALYMSVSPQQYRGSDEENEEIATQKSLKQKKKWSLPLCADRFDAWVRERKRSSRTTIIWPWQVWAHVFIVYVYFHQLD